MDASDEASRAARELSALGASEGGHARAAKLSATERSRIARKAARARWGKDEPEEEIIRAKWLMDGATTLAEAAGKLRERADQLFWLHQQGWKLEQPVEDDYGLLVRPADAGR